MMKQCSMDCASSITRGKSWRSPAAWLAAVVLCASLSMPAAADAAASAKVVLTVQKGSGSAVVNGKKHTIAKPVSVKGTVMVPLSVFKKAFGSDIRLEGMERVRVLQGSHAVVMTIGSTTAWIDGKKVKLPAEPCMIGGTLMVPLRAVAEGIGAKLVTGSNGKLSISLAVKNKGNHPDGKPGEAATSSKSRVGNSYYQWSINYPSGMVIGRNSENESAASFADATGRYYLEIYADAQPAALDAEELLQELLREARTAGDTVLHQEAVTQATVPYARIVFRDTDGMLWEGREYYANKRVYGLYFADAEAVHYKDLEKHGDLLNSFRPSFNKGEKNLKDLSSLKNGLRSIEIPNYGIEAAIPAEWSVNHQEKYYGSEEDGYLSVEVSSVPKGEEGTLSGWTAAMKRWVGEAFVQDAYQIVGVTPVEISGVKGQLLELRYNFGDGWMTEYQLMIQKQGYRYYFEYTVPAGKEHAAKAWEHVLKSIQIDYEVVPSSYGKLGEPVFMIDKSKTASKTSTAYKYAIDIPRYWTPVSERFETGRAEYGFLGGSFTIISDKDTTAAMIVNQLKMYYSEGAGASSMKLIGTQDTTVGGVPAVTLTVHQVKNGIGFTTKRTVLEKDGVTHVLTSVLNDANATEAQKQAVERALASWRPVE